MAKAKPELAKRVPVLIDRENYEAFKNYSDATGVPVAHAIREALSGFTATLQGRVKALTTTATRRT